MTQLPSSIEQYLQEAGFSATELLVLKRLLEGSAMTLRELAAKTGKSTGVLDQATKKLIDKDIVTKEAINDTQKYAIVSLEAIQLWVERDMVQRHTALKRKKDNFDAFLATVQHQKNRPEIEFFEGEAGIKKAFNKLLSIDASDWIHFAPAVMRESDDPLAQFRVELFRERRQKKIFMRVITPEVPLGHRYQSRDVYEYRQSRFVSADEFPVTFEQYIVGDTVACIDAVENKASFIHFPQLADSQRKLFDMMWGSARENGVNGKIEPQDDEAVPIKTILASGLRECFLSRRALVAMATFTVIALLTTAGLYKYTLELMKYEIGQRLMSIAATAAPEIDAEDLEKLRFARDMKRDEYQLIFRKLNEIRDQNEDIAYVYIMRPTDLEDQYMFLADADSNYFLPDLSDPNHEEVVSPGTFYSTYFFGKEYKEEVFIQPTYERDFTTDKWGTYLSAAAPVSDDNGNNVAIIGLDMDTSAVYSLIKERFYAPMWFLAGFLTLVVMRIIFLFQYRKLET